MSSYSQIQKELLNETLLMEVQCQNISYLRIGGYNARPYSLNLDLKEVMRTSELKGHLRWWSRALFLGVYKDAKTYKEIESKFINSILGSESKEGASKIRIKVDWNINEKYKIFKDYILTCIHSYINELLNLYSDYVQSDFYKKYEIKMKISINPSDIYVQFYSQKDFRNLSQNLYRYISNFMNKNVKTLQIKTKQFKLVVYNKTKYCESNKVKLSFTQEFNEFSNIISLPRVRLLLMKRKEEDDELLNATLSEKNKEYINRLKEDLMFYPPNSFQMNLKIYVSNYFLAKADKSNIIEITRILSSLVLMLIFGGSSAFSSRGFSGIKINSLKINENIFKEKEWYEFTKVVKELISVEDEKSLDSNVRTLLKINKINNFSEIPEVPTITLDNKYFKFEIIKIPKEINTLNVLKVLNESVLKSSWKSSFGKSGKEYHTWILGLPRSQKGTGYIVYDVSNKKENEAFRRKSAIGVNLFESTKNVKFVVIHGLLSKDWPLFNEKYVLKWYSKNYHKNVKDMIEEQNSSIEKIFEEAINNLKHHIENNLKRLHSKW